MTHMNNVGQLFREITLRNILSYSADSPTLQLENLNVLIGPNGSGKSNLIEAVALLQATPTSDRLRKTIQRGGGVREWIWQGKPENESCWIEVLVSNPKSDQPLRHVLPFRADQQVFQLFDEKIAPPTGAKRPFFCYEMGGPVLYNAKQKRHSRLEPQSFDPSQSILAQRRDPETYPEISYLASVYERIRIYREWTFGRGAVFRVPQPADMPNDQLEEDFSNLGLFLNRLRRTVKAKKALLDGLRDLYEGLSDFAERIEGGTVQVFFTEGDFIIPATRLSDGTLRYLCLLAILCDPKPPPLICIEEPELGLHPDILPKIADLLVSASERTQLIVTTHSDILVDALTERPEAVVVCEKHDGRTVMKRLDSNSLAKWLEKYRLGELWTRGELGGTRW